MFNIIAFNNKLYIFSVIKLESTKEDRVQADEVSREYTGES